MLPLKIRKIGNSLGTLLPQEVLTKLRVKDGDMVYAIETPDGYQFTPYNPELARQLELAESIMHEDRALLRQLSK